MPFIIERAGENRESDMFTATGPIVVTVTGTIINAVITITCDIGGGEAVAYRYVPGDDTSLARLELPKDSIFKAYIENVIPGEDDIHVAYVNV